MSLANVNPTKYQSSMSWCDLALAGGTSTTSTQLLSHTQHRLNLLLSGLTHFNKHLGIKNGGASPLTAATIALALVRSDEIQWGQESPEGNDSSGGGSIASRLGLYYEPVGYNIAHISKLQYEKSVIGVTYNNRNILDLGENITNNGNWPFKPAALPSPHENHKMFLENRSQYHRLGASGAEPLPAMNTCHHCGFKYFEHTLANKGQCQY